MRAVGLMMAVGLVATPAFAVDHLGDFEAAAMTGDYQAQRNTAFCLSSGQCKGLIAPRPLDACAWRFVILGSGASQVDQSDVGNYRTDCVENLKDDERAVAQRKAGVLFQQIYKRPLSSKPPGPSL